MVVCIPALQIILEKRLSAHEDGIGAKYTKGRTPLRVIYQERMLKP